MRIILDQSNHKVLSFTHHSLPESGQGQGAYPDGGEAEAAKNGEPAAYGAATTAHEEDYALRCQIPHVHSFGY